MFLVDSDQKRSQPKAALFLGIFSQPLTTSHNPVPDHTKQTRRQEGKKTRPQKGWNPKKIVIIIQLGFDADHALRG